MRNSDRQHLDDHTLNAYGMAIDLPWRTPEEAREVTLRRLILWYKRVTYGSQTWVDMNAVYGMNTKIGDIIDSIIFRRAVQ